MAFTNLLEAIYPVGSVYLSTSNISPSELVGGTWVQIKGAMLGITDGNDMAGAASYGGNLAITPNQMPAHTHSAQSSGTGSVHDFCFTLNRTWNTATIQRLRIAYQSGSPFYVMAADTTASDSIGIEDIGQCSTTQSTGGSQNFLPYHFGVYGWYRTA